MSFYDDPSSTLFQKSCGRLRARTDEGNGILTAPTDSSNTNSAQSFQSADITNAPARTLSPTSSNTMNLSHTSPSRSHLTTSKTFNGTIRAVPTESLQIDTFDLDGRFQSTNEPSFTSPSSRSFSTLSNLSSNPPRNFPVANGMVRTISAEFSPTRAHNNVQTSETMHGSRSTSPGVSQWSSAIGGAGLGKSGRVIERLMSDNDMLKRDIKLERINADNAREEKKMAEEKLRILANEHEKVLHDTTITKQFLKRRERLLSELQGQIEVERAKASAALARERGWKEEMERTVVETKAEVGRIVAESNAKIEEAQASAAMMEARNKVMEDHWKQQSAEVSDTVESLGREIESLVSDRKKDDETINLIQNLCDQQHKALAAQTKDKENIVARHEAYKKEQEDALRAIKDTAIKQEAENELLIHQSKKVLGDLKWALAVKQNVKGAQ